MKSKRVFILALLLLLFPCIGFGLLSNRGEAKKTINTTSYSEVSTSGIPQDTLATLTTFPALMVKNEDGESSPIQMDELSINIEVIGNIATTTLEMLFYNDSSQVLEGELYFPLGQGQSVSRFALDVNGKMREGVIVEKNKGQEVFESVVRQNVDPGLLEWTKGNNFKMRIYPIPSKGHKRVLVAYEQELSEIDQSYFYLLPLNFKQRVKNFDLTVEVYNQDIKPKLDNNSLINLKFEKWSENYKATMSKKNFLPNESLAIALPIPNNKKRIYTEKISGTVNSYYYYTTITPNIGKHKAKQASNITLIWDASNSMGDRDVERELELLEGYLSRNRNVKITLVTLRNELKKETVYTIVNGDWSQLRQTLLSINYDGASAYKDIDFSRFSCDAFFLFGDGLSTFGEANGVLPSVPIYSVNSLASANHAYLKYLSAATGGEYVNLLRLEINEALELLSGQSYQYYGTGKKSAFPSIPTSIQKSVHVAGMITGETDLTFNFGFGQANETVSLTIDPELYVSNTGLIRRIWAQKKLSDLLINLDENEEEITALGKSHGLVTPTTSLIVLDDVQDYVDNEISPPKELSVEYDKLLAQKKKLESDELEVHMKKVANDFKAYVAWWNRDIDLNEILKQDKLRKEKNGNGQVNNTLELEGIEPVEEMREESIDAMYMLESPPAVFSPDGRDGAMGDVGEEDNIASPAGDRGRRNRGKIKLEKWEPDAPYVAKIKAAPKANLYNVYLQLKAENASTPSFYLDAADIFIERKESKLALRILSNIAELELESHELLRVLAHRLEQLEYYDLAIAMYQEVLDIRKEEPQSYRDLGLCYEKAGRYQEAIDALYQVVIKPWDGRFPGIETIVLAELNHVVTLHSKVVSTAKIRPEFIANLPVDVRVILNWDSDNCDMDLWVTDPRGEKCFYSHKDTEIGGLISNDFTQGYGPEMFNLKRAMLGEYTVQVNYYGTRSQRLAGPTTIQVQLVTNYGRPNQKIIEVTRRLTESKEVLDIGSFEF